ncbi:MAG: SRPBCC family protein [Gammaproteobacteria bacterium]|nr:SRPBCC family protein [Gammaproteobacteria bacterium]
MSRRTDAIVAGSALLGVLLLAAAPPPASADDVPDQSWLDREQLAAGEIQVQASREGGAITVETAALIDASAEAIWDVLTACEIAPEYVPNVVDCELIETLDDGRAELFVQTIKPAFFIPRFEHVFRLDYHPYERIDVQEVSGPIERMRGSWWFLPQPDGEVLLLHSLEVDPGFPVPRFVLRATMRRDLVNIMEAVRELAETGSLQ